MRCCTFREPAAAATMAWATALPAAAMAPLVAAFVSSGLSDSSLEYARTARSAGDKLLPEPEPQPSMVEGWKFTTACFGGESSLEER